MNLFQLGLSFRSAFPIHGGRPHAFALELFNGGSEELAGYLRGQAIDYIMYVKPTLPWRESMSGGYSRKWWESMKGSKDPNCRLRAPNYAWFFGAMEGIAERYQCLHDSSDAVVVSLKQYRDSL